MRLHLALVAAGLALAACNGSLQNGLYGGQAKPPPPPPPPPVVIETRYRPETTLPTPATAQLAIEVGPGDVRRFPDGAEVLGYVGLRVRTDASEAEVSRALAQVVAARGGTHYIVKDDQTDSHQEVERDTHTERRRAVGRAMSDFGCNMQGKDASPDCYRSHYDGPIYKTTTVSERRVYATAIVVPLEAWAQLPKPFRPRARPGAKAAAAPAAAASAATPAAEE